MMMLPCQRTLQVLPACDTGKSLWAYYLLSE